MVNSFSTPDIKCITYIIQFSYEKNHQVSLNASAIAKL